MWWIPCQVSELTSSKTHGDTRRGMCIVGNSWKAGDGGSSRHFCTFARRVSANEKQINGRVKIKIRPVLTINNYRKVWEGGGWIMTLPAVSQVEAFGDRRQTILSGRASREGSFFYSGPIFQRKHQVKWLKMFSSLFTDNRTQHKGPKLSPFNLQMSPGSPPFHNQMFEINRAPLIIPSK